ncbi:MAG: tRNA (adenosine(37)-N6)-dimethylallyltransferase MiaA, partial [Alphaproteobacteria bacterium]|nr:tRNA (adenosine(37)-N6)-dimethylallyltransferase MiaA [Alphaproteobacteria bacterium]
LPAAKLLGLRALWALEDGTMSEVEAVTAAVTATRQFAKRQETWFRHRMADWRRITPTDVSNIITNMRQNLL